MASLKEKVGTAVHGALVGVVASVAPTLKESKFLKEGVLTPEEFVEAGDHLVFKCKTWQWAAGRPEAAVKYLPADKQYLVTRQVRCASRYSEAIGSQPALTSVMLDGDEWVTSASSESTTEVAPTMMSGCAETRPSAAVEEDDDDAPADMDTFDDESNVIADPAAVRPADDAIARSRTYDISITYDNYYRTPKVWLFGYDEKGQPLESKEMLKDVSCDHAEKTVTFAPQPHVGVQHAFIHPCRHAEVMKKILQRQMDAGRPPRVDQYMILFIKFIASVIPTIEYDYTMEIETC